MWAISSILIARFELKHIDSIMVRFKNRYLLFRINTKDDMEKSPRHSISQHDIMHTVKGFLATMVGNHGLALISPSLSMKYFDVASQIGILRVARAEYRKLWACLSLLTCIVHQQGKNAAVSVFRAACSVSILHISGTIRNCQLKAIAYLKKEIASHSYEATSIALR